MAQVSNPRKQFQFNVIIPGLNSFLAQEVKTADSEFDMATHGDAGFEVKTASLKKVGMLSVNQIMRADGDNSWIWNWSRQIFDTQKGGGALPSEYKKDIIVEQYAPDGITVLDTFYYHGAWPQKINGLDLNRKGSDNTVQAIEFCIDEDDN